VRGWRISVLRSGISGPSPPSCANWAIITGCGGGNDDLAAFITAWRRLDAASTSASDRGADLLTAPVWAPRNR
jgi:hypothetical protein